MTSRQESRIKRHNRLKLYIKNDPFITDEQLAEKLTVSLSTIRLDRQILAIPELRERLRNVAKNTYQTPKSIKSHEVIGDLVEFELNNQALSVMEITADMLFEKTKIVRGHHLYAQANALAVSLIDAEVVLTGSARVRYKRPVVLGEKVFAKAMVRAIRGNTYLVSVHSKIIDEIVFKSQFILFVKED